ncbi:MAG TPA: tautomerase family protein, partial [Nocardioides sp.]|nr:tautomerase family protein [Nocardioides sp.]
RLGIPVDAINDTFLKFAHEALKPYVGDRGYETELHVEEAARGLWNIDSMPPPPPWSETEKLWAKNNKSSPYVTADQ